MQPSWGRVIAIGMVLGIVAGAVVWYLERFEVAKLHAEVGKYLADHDALREWLTKGRAPDGDG